MIEEKKPLFFQTDNDYIDSGCYGALLKYSYPAAAIFQILLRFRHNKTNIAFPSVKTLRELTGFTLNTICKATRILNDFHLIEKNRSGPRFKFKMQYRIIKHDRKGYEKIARVVTTAREQSKPKRIVTTAREQSKTTKTEKPQKKDSALLRPRGGGALLRRHRNTNEKDFEKTIKNKKEEQQPSTLTKEEKKIIEEAEKKRLSLNGQKLTKSQAIAERKKAKEFGIKHTPEENNVFQKALEGMKK